MKNLSLGPKREEAMGGRRKEHNEWPHNLYSSLNIIMKCDQKVSRLKTEFISQTYLTAHGYG
jgi:hypothetical protein